MLKILNLPFKIITHYKALGVQGMMLLFKRNIKSLKFFNITLPKHNSPVLLRNNTSDIGVFYQVFLAKSYNLNYYIDPKIIIDCGANIGLSSVFFKNKFPDAKIIAIEPEQSNFELLEKNTKNYNNVFCINSGIWNKSTNLKIKSNSANWDFTVEEVDYKNEDTIPAISIKNIMDDYDIKQIDILKIDIEGSEKELFEEDYEYWMQRTKVLIIELHDGLREGASKSFFSAISKFNFRMTKKDENLVFYLK
ncbi:FkbM family methyltransferase [Flavivirga abyssicola]|uniref:FkbM family methyltransferase n=1 Tax=Flavivirga abyssicola TaxID=3063533 RepID=UPI0026DFAE19|nr:FkbM family methyltransferase [Flavivirga sp. MEBiC07777]WVK13626.1 FkbM family methyltransferase [Flavivirga sp. MEBiC07777]